MSDDSVPGETQAVGLPRPDEPRRPVPALSLFLAFLRLGLTAFGGPAMVAYIRDLAVRRKCWLTEGSFADGVALCQSIPGATAMQSAAYVGLRAGGTRGALAAFVGFGLPAFVLMLVLSAAYHVGHDARPVVSAFRGLHVIVVALVANAVVTFGRRTLGNWRDVFMASGAAVFLFFRGSPILAVVASAIAGALLHRETISALPLPPAVADGPSARPIMRRPLFLISLAAAAAILLAAGADGRLLRLASLMLKVDLSAFGGGFASVPLMLHQVVHVQGWMDSKTFMDGIALGQITPGPIVITATFVGYQVASIPGALVATVAVFTPSFLLVLLTLPYLDRLRHSLLFRRALRGILASFVGLLLAVTVQFAIAVSWTTPAVLLAVVAFVALWLKVEVLWVVLIGAAVSALVL